MCSISILLIDQYSCIVVILILFGKVIFTNLKKKVMKLVYTIL